LGNLQQQSAALDDEMSAAAERADKLQNLYEEQDELLKEIFGGEYGSEDENRLEAELDQVSPIFTPIFNSFLSILNDCLFINKIHFNIIFL